MTSPMMLSSEARIDPTQIKYVREIEASAIKRVDDILTPIVGPGNARVQVAADVDFSQSEQTAETHRPNATPAEVAMRSQQTSESVNGGAAAQGVPGALSNQPPVPGTAPLTPAPAAATTATTQTSAAAAAPVSTRKDATINYEVDKTVRHTKQSVGTIKRLTADSNCPSSRSQ